MPQQNTFSRQINNFPYPSFVQLLSESVVVLEMKILHCPFCGWKQLCASRPGAIWEFLVVSRWLLQLEIASRSFEKQMFHTVGNTQAQTKESCRLDSIFSNYSLHHVYRQHYIPFHVYAAVPGYGQDIPCLTVLLFVFFFNRPVQRFCFPLLSPCGSRSYASEVDQVSVIVVSRN